MRRLRAVGAAAECATSSSLSSLPSAMRTFFFGAGLDDALVSTAQFGCEARQWRSRTMRFCCTQDANLSHQLHQPFCKSSLVYTGFETEGAERSCAHTHRFGRVTHISSNAHFLRSVCWCFSVMICCKVSVQIEPISSSPASLGFRRLSGCATGRQKDTLMMSCCLPPEFLRARSLESACTNRWKLLLCCWHLCYLRTKM